MKKQLPAYVVLCVISLVAGLLLSLTNALTASRIEQQNALTAAAARMDVLPEAESFETVSVEGTVLDEAYTAVKAGNIIGYTAKKTVSGYGGDIEVVVGMDLNGIVTGVNVGGSDFSETAGLGAKTKEDAFTSQFDGLAGKAVLKGHTDSVSSASVSSDAATDGASEYKEIDSVTGASISSGAVVEGVNECRDFLLTLTNAQ